VPRVAHLLLLTNTLAPSAEVLPSLALLSHHVHILPAEPAALIDSPSADLVLVDARRELAAGRSLCRMLRTTGLSVPLLAILTEGGLAGVTAEWGIDDVLLESAGPAEVEARLRLAIGSLALSGDEDTADGKITAGDLVIDETAYSARIGGRLLDLTYKEFELIKHLAQHPGRVFTRAQLLQEVWGYDYFGGTRTVDVHVRRLRAKLGLEHEVLIGTVRNVGYRFVPEPRESPPSMDEALTDADA
jgi:DNA-binding response OmpR family regulator